MFKKIANDVQMSFDIPDAEKARAKAAKMQFEAAANVLRLSVEHLDHLYDPLKEDTGASAESFIENRGILQGRYSTKIKENFNKVKIHALLAIRKLNFFSTGDSSIKELLNTFESSIDSVEKEVNNLLSTMKNDFESADFRDSIINTIDKIKTQADELEEVINDRVIDHIDQHILAENWMQSTKEVLKLDDGIELPLVTQLFNERKEKLTDFPAANKSEQSFNAGDAQRMLYPDHMSRDTNTGNFGE